MNGSGFVVVSSGMDTLFDDADMPFNLSGELLDESLTNEGEERVTVLAEIEAKRAQTELDL